MIISDAEQLSYEWHLERLGVITASRFVDVLAVKDESWRVVRDSGTTVKIFNTEEAALALAEEKADLNYSVIHQPSEPLEAYWNYCRELAGEILSGEPDDDWELNKSFWTERGLNLEDDARAWYRLVTGREVVPAGLAFMDDFKQVGASVDGLIGADGQAEIKCLKRANHLKIILEDKVPEDYVPQVQGQLYVTGRDWCDFIAYHPAAHIQGHVIRVERDEDYMKRLESGIERFSRDLETMVETLREKAA